MEARVGPWPQVIAAGNGVFFVLKPPFTLLDELVGQCQYETTPVHLVTLHFCIVVREDQSKFPANGLYVFLTLSTPTLPLRGSIISAMVCKVFRCLTPGIPRHPFPETLNAH